MKMTPVLSVVMVGRNDDYGGDFRERLERSVATLHMHLLRSAVPSEIIFVNYNPLSAPDTADFICWPTSTEKVAVNVLTVPGTVHRKLVSDGTRRDVPVLEYVAKNAGIPRILVGR